MRNNVGGITPLIEASYTVAASAGAFADNDVMANSETASAVVPITFALPYRSGEVIGARCAFGPASSTPVTADMTFDLILFRPVTSIPFAAAGYPASNAALAFASLAAALAVGKEHIGVIPFVAASWKVHDTKVAVQRAVLPTGVQSLPFNNEGLGPYSNGLIGLMLARAAWNNGNVSNAFHFALDVRPNFDN